METRPEDPELDKSQMEELKDFLSKRSAKQLKRDLDQTVEDAEADKGPYTSGGTPANATRTYIAIKDSLEKKSIKQSK